MTSYLQRCPRAELQICARSVLANLDQAVGMLQRQAPELRKTMK